MVFNIICTLFLAEIASLHAELYMSMVCFNSSFNLFISASISRCNDGADDSETIIFRN